MIATKSSSAVIKNVRDIDKRNWRGSSIQLEICISANIEFGEKLSKKKVHFHKQVNRFSRFYKMVKINKKAQNFLDQVPVPFNNSVQADDRDAVEKFINKKKNLNLGELLLNAVHNNAAAVSKFLIENGADPNTTDEFGESPLHSASFNNNYEIAFSLLQKGADPNCRSNSGTAPLHKCFSKKNLLLLLEFGADPLLKDDEGWLSLHVMCLNDKADLIPYLIDSIDPADVPFFLNCQVKETGWTPLHFAMVLKGIQTARILKEYGADTTICDFKGKTYLEVDFYMSPS
ncbi:MAG: ankyrin repeat domain-containing protein [SAR324 cluster bacterium]|nr:ankyrin repeat domain-containing protein [SAR324 cluster bacterium]